ncbi:DUF2946 domain-containing protein [Niveibacterium sp. 24ML]|uniref:DUF2946 domain-containing protein n=1 Tax=Niveibacterium sp. 24ML TaxID=2985512 RepID=UPI00227043AE|nr:DUF2946 domain-containing protein [Niveibacterium sp. 24ML]MCX9155324.1 DUF2946 domain-containing protein [Niveibacterium sp. 24ML]
MKARLQTRFTLDFRSAHWLARCARLALFAVLLNAFAPLVSTLLAAHDPVRFDALCSAQVRPGSQAPGNGGGQHPACHYCVVHAASYALAVPPAAAAVAVAFIPPRPDAAVRFAARVIPRWPSAQPRAPPQA